VRFDTNRWEIGGPPGCALALPFTASVLLMFGCSCGEEGEGEEGEANDDRMRSAKRTVCGVPATASVHH
jgi:hypothetical protein